MSPSSSGPTAPSRPDAPEEHSEGTSMSATDTERLTDGTQQGATTQDADQEDTAQRDATGPAPAGKATAGKPRGRVRTLPVVLGVLAVAAAVAVGLLGLRAWTLYSAQQAETAALDSARTRTVQVLSFDPKTVDADVARAKQQLSGSFAAQFDQLANVLILPSAKQQGLTSQVEVKNAAVIDSQPDRAEVLLFLHQKVSSTSTPQPVEGTIQVKTTVNKAADGQWLISNLQPLS